VSRKISRARARVRAADRAGVRRFLERFAGQRLEVALEVTIGWGFLVEELRAIGAVVRLAEPAETARTHTRVEVETGLVAIAARCPSPDWDDDH
jgi:S-adenosylhomocysteine hydrolase